MAGEMVYSVIRWATNKANSLIASLSSSSSAGQDLQQLHTILLRIKTALDEDDVLSPLETEKLRLRELKDVAYDAEDVLDEYHCELTRAMIEGSDRYNPKVDNQEVFDSLVLPLQLSLPADLTKRVKEIICRFEAITREWNTLQSLQHKKKRRIQSWTYAETASYYDPSSYFCREDDKNKLIEFLLSDKENGGTVSVLPILGMGGIGKTTLAQHIYSDPLVCKEFKLRGWVCVSQEFDVVNLTKKIIMSINPYRMFNHSEKFGELQDILREEVQGKKFLLVLDDVWNEKHALWELLRAPLVSASGGGKVIVTTRNESVAEIMQTVAPHRLACLSFDTSWLLFQQVAFQGQDLSAYADLVDIARGIVNKCRGLPLAIKVLGGMLCGLEDVEAWIDISESELWELEEGEDHILPALKLSYNFMPSDLKRCFMYFALFPKDSLFEKEKVIYMWMSQGLLLPNQQRLARDIGNDYFTYFLQSSLLQVVDTNAHGKKFVRRQITELVMHDLVHDLACSVATEEFARQKANSLSYIPEKLRHISLLLNENTTSIDLKHCSKPEILRTVIASRFDRESLSSKSSVSTFPYRSKVSNDFFSNMKCIQTLDLSCTNIIELPDSVGNLKRLRYLCLRHTAIESLPQSLFTLHNLQALDINFTKIQELPRGIGNLINLRLLQLHVENVCMPREVGKLTRLETLSGLNISPGSWHCGLAQLKEFANLSGDLKICGLKNAVADDTDDCRPQAYLRSKHNLRSLIINWTNTQTPCDHRYSELGAARQPACKLAEPENLLESLEAHTNITQLEIIEYNGVKFPRWVGDVSFSNLFRIKLESCRKCDLLPPLGQLPALKFLEVSSMCSLQRVGPEFCVGDSVEPAFPRLKELHFLGMDKWTEWHGTKESDFPHLERLELLYCPKLKKLPRRFPPSSIKLWITSCDALTAVPAAASVVELNLTSGWDTELLSSSYFPALRKLVIEHSKERLLRLSGQSLPSLKKLKLIDCHKLRSVEGLFSLTSLEVLRVLDCYQLSFPEDEKLPSSLNKVKITESFEEENI